MGTKKKAKAEPVETPAADQPALAVGMIWTDPRDGQKYNVVESKDKDVSCKGCHFFAEQGDCPESDPEGTPTCEKALPEIVNFVKVCATTEPVPEANAEKDTFTDLRDNKVYDVLLAGGDVEACNACAFESGKGAVECPTINGRCAAIPFGDDRYFSERKPTEATPAPFAPAADLDQVPKVKKAKPKKAKPTASPTVPIITGLTTRQISVPASNLGHAAWNKRGEIDPDSVADLVKSIKAVGLIQRIVVMERVPPAGLPFLKDYYTILAGHRRFEACKLAGLDPIPCDVVECDEKQSHMITAIENMHRSDLSVMQEAEVVEDLIEVGYSAEEVAEQTGWHLRTVYRRANLRTLTPKWRNKAHAVGLCGAFLEEVARMPVKTQDDLFKQIDAAWYRNELFASGGDVERLKRHLSDLTMKLSTAPWAKKHPEWCANCDRCSDARADLFEEGEVGENALCLDKPCWEQRKAAMVEELKAELKAKHGEIKTATGDQYRYDQLPNTKGRKDKDHSIPVLITDGDAAGKVLWVASAADKKAAKERGEPVTSGSKQPSLAEKRQAWVIRKVRDMIDASRQKGSLDNPFLLFNDSVILQTVALTGTEHSSSWHKAKEWDGIESQPDEDVKVKLWGRVAPVLIARMNYPTITDCGPYYDEAVTQALWLFNINKRDLDAEAAEAIKDKSKKGA